MYAAKFPQRGTFDYDNEMADRLFIVARYVVVVTVYDYYNFNKGDEVGDGLGSDLNNIGYGLHEMGLGKDYSWTASYTYETKWKVFG